MPQSATASSLLATGAVSSEYGDTPIVNTTPQTLDRVGDQYLVGLRSTRSTNDTDAPPCFDIGTPPTIQQITGVRQPTSFATLSSRNNGKDNSCGSATARTLSGAGASSDDVAEPPGASDDVVWVGELNRADMMAAAVAAAKEAGNYYDLTTPPPKKLESSNTPVHITVEDTPQKCQHVLAGAISDNDGYGWDVSASVLHDAPTASDDVENDGSTLVVRVPAKMLLAQNTTTTGTGTTNGATSKHRYNHAINQPNKKTFHPQEHNECQEQPTLKLNSQAKATARGGMLLNNQKNSNATKRKGAEHFAIIGGEITTADEKKMKKRVDRFKRKTQGPHQPQKKNAHNSNHAIAKPRRRWNIDGRAVVPTLVASVHASRAAAPPPPPGTATITTATTRHRDKHAANHGSDITSADAEKMKKRFERFRLWY